MKLNISYPSNGTQKLVNIEDEHKLRGFYDKRISQEVKGDFLGDEWKGYIFKITGGNDKEGFPMLQGIMTAGRVRLLLRQGSKCYRARRDGERRRKSIHGCIVDSSLSVLALVIVKKGDNEIPGLTDNHVPRQYGPKRAGKIRKLFNLSKEDDVKHYVIRRPVTFKNPEKTAKKPRTKAPKIQRLITPVVLQRRRRLLALKKEKRLKSVKEASDYLTLMKSLNKKVRLDPSMADKTRKYQESLPKTEKIKPKVNKNQQTKLEQVQNKSAPKKKASTSLIKESDKTKTAGKTQPTSKKYVPAATSKNQPPKTKATDKSKKETTKKSAVSKHQQQSNKSTKTQAKI